MKQQSVHDLWEVKKLVLSYADLECEPAVVMMINDVLYRENGIDAVAYKGEDSKESNGS